MPSPVGRRINFPLDSASRKHSGPRTIRLSCCINSICSLTRGFEYPTTSMKKRYASSSARSVLPPADMCCSGTGGSSAVNYNLSPSAVGRAETSLACIRRCPAQHRQLLHASGKNGVKVRTLFFPGDYRNLDFFKSVLLEELMQLHLAEAKPI